MSFSKEKLISTNITKLSNECFESCINLINIIIPASVKEFREEYFSDYINLTKNDISTSITKIDNSCL